jgi:alkanesulfonate monooxygenase SsuD/methylene tetrahydromethanopterin reductase-like flavin-dependent oxidoreductase (luciferase family)/putative sterol carrier protein
LFYEHQMPRPWTSDGEEKTLTDALDQVELADKIGFDYIWEVEHHFLEEYSHSSAPEVFLAAASQRTKRIRLGHGIVQLPPGFNHPARIAERIATLDLISGGRVDFGTGEASSQQELGGFGVDREQKRDQWAEAVDAVTRMFVEEPFAGYDGRFVKMPPRNVVPKPKQKPHPPLWVACSRRDTIITAAEKGLGALSFSFVEPEDAKEWVEQYYEVITSERCIPAGFEVNPNFAVVVPFMCHDDEETAIERGIDGAHFFGYSLAHYYVFGKHRPGHTVVWDEFQEHREEFGFARQIVTAEGEPLGVKLLQQGLGSMRGAIGTPAQITELIQRYEAAGVDQIIFVSQAGRNRHEHICESMELFGQKVLPEFAAQADDIDARRKERLSEATTAALYRRLPAREAPSDYVVTAQGEPDAAPSAIFENGSSPTDLPGAVLHKARGLAESAFRSFVRSRTDSQVEKTVGSDVGLRILFRGMEAAFNPKKANGWKGEIQYDLTRNGSTTSWHLRVDADKAVARRGQADAPAVTMKMSTVTLARISAGEVDGAAALMQGDIDIEGDMAVAARLSDMFGGPTHY